MEAKSLNGYLQNQCCQVKIFNGGRIIGQKMVDMEIWYGSKNKQFT